MIKPKKLQKGDTIAIISPSSPTKDPTAIPRGKEFLESMGYIFVLLFSRLFFGEKFTRRKLLGVTLIFAGILIYNL